MQKVKLYLQIATFALVRTSKLLYISIMADLDTTSLPTISEEDGDCSVRSGSTTKSDEKKSGYDDFLSVLKCSGTSNNNKNGDANGTAALIGGGPPQAVSTDDLNSNDSDRKKEKKKKKKGKHKEYSDIDHDTAQQILVDLCTEMKDLKTSMQHSQDKASENLDSNQQVMRKLANQMEMFQGNMKQIDVVIESKATPEQIEELARIRAVQEMMKVVTDDKERTVSVYEQHARRGYEEIERLRQDLTCERKEVAALRAELDIVRGDRQRMMSGGGLISPSNVYVNAGDSVGGDSGTGGSHTGPGVHYINGGLRRQFSGGGDFDDMTLETKGSYETVQYEMKSLKKRIIHMKKKLTISQQEAKEAGSLRTEVERLRVQCETEKKASAAKDETIKRLQNEIQELMRNQANASSASYRQSNVSSLGSKSAAAAVATTAASSARSSSRRASPPSSKTVVTTTKKTKWWQNL